MFKYNIFSEDEFGYNINSFIPSIFARSGEIFGGGGGGGGGLDITQASTLTGGQRELLDALTSLLTGQVGQGITPFGGQRVAGISPLQQQGFGLAGGLGQGIGAGLDLFGQTISQFDPSQGQNILGGALSSLSGATQQFDPESILGALEPGRQLALNTFSQDIIPQLSEKFGATSGASGAFNKALSEAGANLSLGVSAQAAPFLFAGQQNQLNRQLQGAQLGGSLAQVPGALAQQGTQIGGQATDLLSQLLNIGGVQRGIEQQGLTAEQQKFFEGQAFNNPFLLNFLNPTLGTSAFENIIQPQGPNAASAILPGLGSFLGSQTGGFLGGSAGTGGGGILGGLSPTGGTGGDIQLALQLAGLFSDMELKTDIQTIPDALNKLNQLDGKTFKFIDGVKSGGVIAQQIEDILPDAVDTRDGHKTVDYTAIIGLLINAVNELARKVG